MAIKKLSDKEFQALMLRVPAQKRKKKKTKSLYDIPMEERTFWGDDKGTELLMSLVRLGIKRSLNDGYAFDFTNDVNVDRLSKKHVIELKEYQFNLMIALYEEGVDNCYYDSFSSVSDNVYIVVEFDSNTNQYSFKTEIV